MREPMHRVKDTAFSLGGVAFAPDVAEAVVEILVEGDALVE
jgi:hypothetical protein